MAYIYSGRKKYIVESPIRREVDRLNDKLRYHARKQEECIATKKQVSCCEGDCFTCGFWSCKHASVEERESRKDTQLADYTGRNSQAQLHCIELLIMMQAADPDGERMGKLYLEGCTDEEVALEMGVHVSTVLRRRHRIGMYLRRYGYRR